MDTTTLTHTLLTLVKRGNAIDLSGKELGALLKAITEHEVAEGGPYGPRPPNTNEAREADFGLTLLIEEFLYLLEIDLPAVTAYIEAQNRHPSSRVLSRDLLKEVTRIYHSHPHDQRPATVQESRQDNEDETRMVDRIIEAARERFATLPSDVAEEALAVAVRTIKGNPDRQMPLMSYFVRQALGKKRNELSDDTIVSLGLANVFFWTAFIIYDDFWDEDEAAKPMLLPIANLMARHYIEYFTMLLPERSGFPRYVRETMDALDAANAWETMHCRMRREGESLLLPDNLPEYGDYEMKYRPAGGHTLGPVALLRICGCDIESPDVTQFLEYCKHYLIAMQLNDDVHDWKEDLERGHISTAVAVLLRVWREEHPDRNSITLETDLTELEQLFWFRVLTPLCSAILAHGTAARHALISVSAFQDAAPLTRFITRSEDAARAALSERVRTDDFIQAFNPT